MTFVACGLNHKTAPLEIREKIAPPGMQDELLHNLIQLPTIDEAAILTTCNRTEIYYHTHKPQSIAPWLAAQHRLPIEKISPYLYVHPGHEGIRHTLRVASGLDSMMLGEPQILGQMKQAYQHGCRSGTIKNHLRHAFQYVFRASKRIRNCTGIGNNPISIAYAAAQLISQLYSDYNALQLFLIGSGETASLVAKYLHKQGVKKFLVASRSSDNANQLASAFEGKALTIGDIPNYLSQADIVISATACPLPFINKKLVEHALQRRASAPMLFLDLAVPRDIEADVAELPGIHLYNIDDLKSITLRGMDERRKQARQAEELIENELDNYIRSYRTLQAKEIICDYRKQMHSLATQELQLAQKKLAAGSNENKVLDEFCRRLVQKLSHQPTVGLYQAAWDNKLELLDLARYLFTDRYKYEEID